MVKYLKKALINLSEKMKDIPNRYHFRPEYIRRRRLITAGITAVILTVVIVVANLVLSSTAPITSPKLTNLKLLTQSTVKPVWPSYGSGAIGAIGFNGVLAEYGGQSTRPIASITKLITALVVLEAKPLHGDESGPSITLTQNDQRIYDLAVAAGAAAKPVTVGSSMTEREMIEAMLLPSAANYSETLAMWAYGSVNEYLKAADNWLVANNLIQTKVVDTSGLLPENISNPSDLINLGKLVLKNSSLALIVSLEKANIPGVGEVSNSNQLLGVLGVNGIKTGTTYEAGACMLFSSVIDVGGEKITIIGVLLGADNRGSQNTDIKTLLGSVQPGFKSVKLASRGQEFAEYKTAWGQTSKLISNKDISSVVWSDTPISITVQADKASTLKSGERKGEATIKVGTKVFKQPLIADGSITSPNILWRLTHF